MSSSRRRRIQGAAGLAAYRTRFAIGELTGPGRTARDAARLWLTPPPARRPAALGTRVTSWGEGPPVYFMHGWGGSGGQVRSLVEPLVGAGFRVVAFDGPGHGVNPRRPTHAGEFAAALAAVAEQHGAPSGIVAHSLGAVAVARAALVHRVPTGRLVLLAPVVDAGTALTRFARLVRLRPRTRAGLPAEVRRQTGWGIEDFTSRGLVSVVEGRSVLIVQDPHDPFTPYAESLELAATWPGATLRAAEGLGHHRLLQDPSVVQAAVAFLT